MPQICVLSTIAVLLGSFITWHLYPPPKLEFKGQAWCYYGDYHSLKDYDTTVKPSHALVDVHSKGVAVYTKCEQN